MAGGLFELRKDPITGWWVATIVDRAFHRDRFARAAEPVDDRLFGCANCSTPGGRRRPDADAQGLRLPRRRARTTRRASSIATTASPRCRSPRPARPAAGGRSSRRPASTGRCTPSARTLIEALVAGARDALAEARGDRPDRVPARSSRTGAPRPAPGRTTCASTCTTCPRSRTGSPRSWAARRASSSARASARSAGSSATRSRRRDRLVWEDADSVAFAPYASRSPFEIWIVPRRHDADFGRADDARHPGHRRGAPPGPRAARERARRPAVQPRPAHGAAARAGRRHVSLALGDPPPPARDRRPGAGNRPAGQPRLARGRRRGIAGPQPARREVDRVDSRRARSAPGVTSGGARLVFGPSSARRPSAARPPSHPHGALVAIDASSPTFATRSAAPRPADRDGAGR